MRRRNLLLALGTGFLAGCTKLGGVLAQLLSILALIPSLDMVALMITVPTIAALGATMHQAVGTGAAIVGTLSDPPPTPIRADT